MHNHTELMLQALLEALGESPALADHVQFTGRRDALPSPYAVSALAAATSAAAALGVAALHAARSGGPLPEVHVDHVHAAAAFRSERYLRGDGIPASSDPITGDYACSDGFIRLHTHYPWHRDAVLDVLGVAPERAQVAAAVARFAKRELEARVVAAGGAAAAMYREEEHLTSPLGRALLAEPLVGRLVMGCAPPLTSGALPLAGVRVLDLTRVLAGPVCTRVLSAWGARVLRIDPPDFPEAHVLLADTTWGKHRAALALHTPAGNARLWQLLEKADVLVMGYRPGALTRLGLTPAALRERVPGLVVAQLDAYGYDSPWSERRGFDSLVQMSTGIAARGALVSGELAPVPLPAQALDHGTGYLSAAAVVFALCERARTGSTRFCRLSLARTAHFLMAHGHQPSEGRPLTDGEAAPFLEHVPSDFGPLRRVRVPGELAGLTPTSSVPAGPLGVHAAEL